MSDRKRQLPVLVVQLAGSALVLVLLLRSAGLGELVELLAGVDLLWLLVAAVARALLLILHEVRLYLALLPWQRASLGRVLGVGFTSGLVNTVVPARGGDLLAVTLLKVECGAPVAPALVAVGLASGLEAVAFGVVLLVLLVLQGPALAVGSSNLELLPQSLDLALLTAGVTLVIAGGLVALRVLHKRVQGGAAKGGSKLAWLAEGGRGLGPEGLALNVALAGVQGFLVVGIWVALFRSLSIDPISAWLAAALIQAAGSIVVAALPHGFGAGQAAAAVFVLAALGVDSASALAVAGLAWVLHIGLAFALGVVPLWRRLARLGDLLGRSSSVLEGAPEGVGPVRRRRRSRLRRLAFAAVMLALTAGACVGVAEAMLRLFAPQAVLPVLFADDARTGKRTLPGLNVRHRVPGSFDSWVRTDEAGFRIPEKGRPPACEGRRVVVIGDSFGFGMGVLEPDSFGGLLREHLGPEACVTIAAVPATGTCWQLARYEDLLAELEPELVILESFGNDPVECGMGGIYRLDDRGGLGQRELRELPNKPSREVVRWLSAKSHLFVLANTRWFGVGKGAAPKGGAPPPPPPGAGGPGGPRSGPGGAPPSFLGEATRTDLALYQACLGRLAEVVDGHGGQLVVVPLPEEWELPRGGNRLLALVREVAVVYGFPVVDPTEELRQSNALLNVWFEEGHFDERAHAAVHRAIVAQVGELLPVARPTEPASAP